MPRKRPVSSVRFGEQRTIRGLGSDDAEGTNGVQTKDSALAIDPGGTNGWALWTPRIGYNVGECSQDDLWGLLGLASEHNVDALVYERFDLREDVDWTEIISAEQIGVIKEWSRQEKWRGRIVPQRPLEAKFFWTDKRITDLGLWVPGKPHAMDALRHLLYFQRDYSGLKRTDA